jgi:hypothetical protein
MRDTKSINKVPNDDTKSYDDNESGRSPPGGISVLARCLHVDVVFLHVRDSAEGLHVGLSGVPNGCKMHFPLLPTTCSAGVNPLPPQHTCPSTH